MSKNNTRSSDELEKLELAILAFSLQPLAY